MTKYLSPFRPRVCVLLAIVWGALLSLGGAAVAHTRSETFSSWTINGATVRLTFTVPDVEARRISNSGDDTATGRQLESYLKGHVLVQADGVSCLSLDGRNMEGATPGFYKFDFMFECPSERKLKIGSSAFFQIVPTHIHLAQIHTSSGEFIDQLLSRERQTLEVSGDGAESKLESAGFVAYVTMGVAHIFTGFDHQLFLIGLVLISRRFRDLAFVITGFTLGHSVTLALAVTGILRPQAQHIDTLVALTIALIGVENVVAASRRPVPIIASTILFFGVLMALRVISFGNLPPALLVGTGVFAASYLVLSEQIHDGARLRLTVTMVFGLIHGFGFASDLLEMHLPAERLAELLVGFNLGVELGQLTIVVGVLAVAAAFSALRIAPPRQIVVETSSAVLIGVGIFWFVDRSFS